jgi:rhamnose utilization protein RhaD (predicted bifunctional aldolase and dehydrogenase)
MQGMTQDSTVERPRELQGLLELTARVGRDPLLTQASTGNSSVKLNGILWVKASGKWMADALKDDILIPLDLREIVVECLRQDVDPAGRYAGASLETALHAALPHPVVLHVHCVDTIAWAVRKDGQAQLQARLQGLRWQWIPYTASGLPLARELERALRTQPDADLFVLSNHGLVIAGDTPERVESLLAEVRRRLGDPPREAPAADYPALSAICADSSWTLPHDDEVHALGTDAISRSILAGGLLYPCQALLSDSGSVELFRPVRRPLPGIRPPCGYPERAFLVIEGCGVVVHRTAKPAELAMISGLARVVQRVPASAPLRYLTDAEIAGISYEVAYRYRELANANQISGR